MLSRIPSYGGGCVAQMHLRDGCPLRQKTLSTIAASRAERLSGALESHAYTSSPQVRPHTSATQSYAHGLSDIVSLVWPPTSTASALIFAAYQLHTILGIHGIV